MHILCVCDRRMHAVPWAALLYTHMYVKLIKQCVSQRNSSAVYTESLNGNVADVSMYIVHAEVERTCQIGKGGDYTVYSPLLHYQGCTPYGSIRC